MKYSDIRQAAREGRASVHLHGFRNLPDGGQEYCDDPALIDGWAIYVRVETPDDPQQPFDLHELPDKQTYSSAEGAARAIALQLLGDAEAWNHD
ncbi:hypothetical protein [Roseovarius indicus]|uniref:hypothetical protein n=1 Tax=Roseovarius indicus TaxID=540747 RepID=UPI0032EEBF6E